MEWIIIIVSILPHAVAAAVLWGSIITKVKNLEDQIKTKVGSDYCNLQHIYQSKILEEIKSSIKQIKEKVG